MLKKLLDRPVTVTMGLLVVMVLGAVSVRLLPVSLIPDVDVPYVTVQVTAPELSAREIDETVLRPLRQQLIQIHSLEDIQSEARDGDGSILLSFREGADMDYLFIEVNEKIDRTSGSLRGIERPKVLKTGAGDIPAFYIDMTLKEDDVLPEGTDRDLFPVTDRFVELSRFAKEVVSKRLEQLDEVAMVDVSGCVSPEILVIPDMEALREAGITEGEFESLVASADVHLGSLTIRDGEYRYNVKFQYFASSKEDIEDIYINRNGRLLQVKDIARVLEHPAKRTGLARSDGKDAVVMAVIKQSDARMADLKRSVEGLMRQFGQDYPEVEFKVTRDQTELLEYSINNLVSNIIAGVVLACIVIFLFMRDFRSPALVAFTIPTALVFSMLVFYAVGLTVNIISLSGLVLGVGMMVDNTIVLTDNITARWQRGEPLRRAVLKGTGEVVAPMLSSVLTTCAVFIPLIFVSGIAGAMFYDQAMAVTIVLLTSYAVTVTVIPVYYWWWYRKLPSFRPNPVLERFSFERITGAYEHGLKWMFRHRWVGWTLFAVSFAGVAVCFIFMPKEKLPEMTYTDTLVKVDWNDHVSLEESSRRVAGLESLSDGLAEHNTSMVGTQQFVLGHSGDPSASEAVLYFKCGDAPALEELKDRISGYMDRVYPRAVYSFEASGNIFDMVFGEKEPELVARLRPVSVPDLDARLLAGITGVISGRFPEMRTAPVELKKDVLYKADPELMALYGVTYYDLVTVLENALNGNELFDIVQGDETLPVVMGVDARDLSSVIGEAVVRKGDADIPVAALMRQTWDEDLKVITAGAEGSYYPLPVDLTDCDAVDAMSGIRDAVHEDGNFEVSFSGAYFTNREMVLELAVVLAIALLLLYLILASQFESLVQPFVVMSEIVIDIFAALLLVWVCGATVNLMSMIGLVVVSGIVINDSILKIDTVNRLRKEGFRLKHAIMEAGRRRLKAIVMTSLTTILSVCPFLGRGNMGDDLQYPMSLVIIGGMVVGTVVSLLFVPVVYYEIYKGQEER